MKNKRKTHVDLVNEVYRIANCKNQKEFGEKIGESQGNVSHILNSGRALRLDKFVEWCDTFGIEITLK